MNQNEVASLGRTPRRARRLLNSLLQNKVVTPAGLNWLIASTDPFHDEQLNVEGFPDLSTSKCITQTLTYTENVTTPTPLTTALWDAHVFFNPNTPPIGFTDNAGTGLSGTNNSFYRSGVDPMGNVSQTGSGLVLFAGTNCLTVANGQDWQSASTGVSISTLQLPASFCQGYFRVIGAGIEVTNTTAELYKGGTCTVYRSPAFSCPGTLRNVASYEPTATTTSTVTTTVVTSSGKQAVVIPERGLIEAPGDPVYGSIITDFQNLPPSTQAQAALYPNSRVWGASEGAYIVCTMNRELNPFVAPVPGRTSGLILGVDNNQLTTGAGTRTAWLPKWTNGAVLTPTTPGLCNNIPFDISGAVFSGLNSNTTLQVTTRYFVERLPAISDPNLLVLARNPCPYDPMVLELYSRAILELPVAVKVGENPLGEWFFDILQTLAGVAPAIGAAFGPVGAAVGTAVGSVGTAALQARKAKNAKKKN